MLSARYIIRARLRIERVNYARQCYSLSALVVPAITMIVILSRLVGGLSFLSNGYRNKILLTLEFFGVINSTVSLISTLLTSWFIEVHLEKIRNLAKGNEGLDSIVAYIALEEDQEEKKTFLKGFGTKISILSSLASLVVCFSTFILRLLGRSRLPNSGMTAAIAVGTLSLASAIIYLFFMAISVFFRKSSKEEKARKFLTTHTMIAGGSLGVFGALLTALESNKVFTKGFFLIKDCYLHGHVGHILGLMGIILCAIGTFLSLSHSSKMQVELDKIDRLIKKGYFDAKSQDISRVVKLGSQGILDADIVYTWVYCIEHGKLKYKRG